MKKLLFAAVAATALSAAALTPAQAQGGCGPYAHRGWDGFCHPNGWGPRPFYHPYGWGGGWRRGPYWHRGWGYHRHW